VEDADRFSALGSGDDGEDFVPAAIEMSIFGTRNDAAMDADGNLAASTESGKSSALCCDGESRVEIIKERQGCNRLLVGFACLDAERALTGGGTEIGGIETLANPFGLFETIKAGSGKQDRVHLALA